MLIDDPATKREVEAEFARYEAALTGNDVATLDALFANDARTIRYGIAENLYGYSEIAAFRAALAGWAGAPAGADGDHDLWQEFRDCLYPVPAGSGEGGEADADLGAHA